MVLNTSFSDTKVNSSLLVVKDFIIIIKIKMHAAKLIMKTFCNLSNILLQKSERKNTYAAIKTNTTYMHSKFHKILSKIIIE